MVITYFANMLYVEDPYIFHPPFDTGPPKLLLVNINLGIIADGILSNRKTYNRNMYVGERRRGIYTRPALFFTFPFPAPPLPSKTQSRRSDKESD